MFRGLGFWGLVMRVAPVIAGGALQNCGSSGVDRCEADHSPDPASNHIFESLMPQYVEGWGFRVSAKS